MQTPHSGWFSNGYRFALQECNNQDEARAFTADLVRTQDANTYKQYHPEFRGAFWSQDVTSLPLVLSPPFQVHGLWVEAGSAVTFQPIDDESNTRNFTPDQSGWLSLLPLYKTNVILHSSPSSTLTFCLLYREWADFLFTVVSSFNYDLGLDIKTGKVNRLGPFVREGSDVVDGVLRSITH